MDSKIDFKTTQWSLVVRSQRDQDDSIRRQSLGQLFTTYWYPLFAYLRRKGCSPEDAADYVQGFFAEVVDKDFLQSVAPEKGRFRWFLMSAVKRLMANEIAKQNTLKRGGHLKVFSLNVADAESRYLKEPVDGWSPEKLFDRQWALEVLRQALGQLREIYAEAGNEQLYDLLQPALTGDVFSAEQYAQLGEQLGMKGNAVKVATYRLRDRYRGVLRQIVAETLTQEDGIDDELDTLLNALRPD